MSLKGWSKKKKEALIKDGWLAVKDVWKQQAKYKKADPSSPGHKGPSLRTNGKRITAWEISRLDGLVELNSYIEFTLKIKHR